MSKECIENGTCPRIRKILEHIKDDNFMAGPFPIHLDLFSSEENSGAGKLLRACVDTYDCSGPQISKVEVGKGVFRKKLLLKSKLVVA